MMNEALRVELTDASVLGPSAVHGRGDCIELRGGRIIPSVEIARSELAQLRRVSKRLAAHTLDTLIDLPPFPTPTQLKRITLNEVTGC